ncbi:hypothetical protein NHX12_025308 [Muraenolepis orangiensis]|uniref:Uncharacterized protein n=1 Tax=Muraenolepis orangiensis TaxID=630683 RepID=A0A9Q0IRG4_9TELE|nr:hypothetical protein NHX12_025308 [Muraenolepis orangiensis]
MTATNQPRSVININIDQLRGLSGRVPRSPVRRWYTLAPYRLEGPPTGPLRPVHAGTSTAVVAHFHPFNIPLVLCLATSTGPYRRHRLQPQPWPRLVSRAPLSDVLEEEGVVVDIDALYGVSVARCLVSRNVAPYGFDT